MRLIKKELATQVLTITAILLIGIYIIFTSTFFLPKESLMQTYRISIMDFAFNHLILTINAGDSVIWTNNDYAMHTITSDTGTELNSSTLEFGQTYSHAFKTPGTYNYHCSHHPALKGIIIVQ